MIKVNGLNVIFIEFYVPGLTPRLNNAETSLRLSENITLFVICRMYLYRCHQQRDLDRHQMFGGYHLCIYIYIIYVYIYIYCTVWGTGRYLVASLLVYPLTYTFHLRPRLRIFSGKEKS
jgi:hypothetical protein